MAVVMAVREVEGAALLIAGYGAPGTRTSGAGAFDFPAVHVLGQIGEALLSTGKPWHIKRLTAAPGDRYVADRKTIKRTLGELVNDPVRVAVLVLLGEIVEIGDELCLVTGAEAHEYPEDATLPLAWIRERLANARADHLVVALSARGDGEPARWLGALGTERERHVFAIDAPSDHGNPMIDALLAGLCGDALDPQTGTVTMASLSRHLSGHARAVQGSARTDTVAQPPPLAGLWDVRHSQLANRPRPQHAGELEDLTGTVLPGRFRIDELVARGTFGAVYRARQLSVERDVAIKVLHADIDPSSEDGRLFVQEIRAVGRIDHQNVVRIYQADITHDGRLFFAMEYLDGSDLQQLGADKLPKQRAVDLVRQLLAGLGAAHDAGLVHADIKPANAIVIPPRVVDDLDTEPLSARSSKHERAVLVDFGLARLRMPDRPAQSAGGTPAYMAPEQLCDGRVDARSDLFSLALVLVWLLTGWRRPNAATLVPPVELIDDPHLRGVLARALAVDPAKRFRSARELDAALAGNPVQTVTVEQPAPARPFRQLAAFTEADRGRLHGREADLALITEHALYRRCVVYAAPSGTGKTSLLCAGLLPRLEALGIAAIYVRCRTDFTWSVVKAISPGATSITDAITRFHEARGGKLVLVVDQLEAALADPEFVSSLLAFDRWPRTADVSIVLSVREDYLARLLASTQPIEPNLPIVRLAPLSPEGARTAIVAPLFEARLSIEPELLEVLLKDLERAAAAIGPEMGWGATPAVFPPHLQLACSVLHEAMTSDNTSTMTLAHYRRLGGFEAIVGEHLDRVIENELADGRDLIARDLFLALVTSANQRAIRSEAELLSIVGAKHGGAERVESVIKVLHARGLLVPVHKDADRSWELVHDSLVARVLAWVDRKDLARRRAIELLRHHLRRSTKAAPSLLGRKELRELASHEGAVEELDEEWSKREAPDVGWMPSSLVARSRQVLLRARATYSLAMVAALLVGGLGFHRSRVEAARTSEIERLKALDLGRFELSLEMFDWDPVALRAVPVPPTGIRWMLHAPSPTDPDTPGPAFDDAWLVRATPRASGTQLVERVEAHGGRALLVVHRTGCSSSVLPLHVPGFTQRELEAVIQLQIPSCRTTGANLIQIPAGTFLYGGVGTPPAPIMQDNPSDDATARRLSLPSFAIDRLEVTNAEFAIFAAMARWTGDRIPSYPTTTPGLRDIGRPRHPAVGVTWHSARAYCRFLGKQLPSTEEWVKALRGGEVIDGKPNPVPDRNLPWGLPADPIEASIGRSEGAGDVGSSPRDRSPYGVLDLAGSVTEWTESVVNPSTPGFRIVRGGSWSDTQPQNLVDFVALSNLRDERQIHYGLGFRCVLR